VIQYCAEAIINCLSLKQVVIVIGLIAGRGSNDAISVVITEGSLASGGTALIARADDLSRPNPASHCTNRWKLRRSYLQRQRPAQVIVKLRVADLPHCVRHLGGKRIAVLTRII